MKPFRLNNNNLLFGLLLSIVFTAAVLPFVKIGSKYSLTVQKDIRIDPNNIYIYKDVDHDGTSEKITVIKDFGGFSAILLDKNNFNLFEWNLHGKIGNDDFLCTGDQNNDGVDELFVLTHAHDSIFLNAFSVKKQRLLFPPLFITKFKLHNGEDDLGVRDPHLIDLDNNGKKELVFILFSGFSKSIRAIYKVNLENRKIQYTPKAGSCPSSRLFFKDITGNGDKEIMGPIASFGNCKLNYPLSDSLLWFCVYSKDLHYLFKPIKVGKYPGTVWISPIRIKNKNLLVVFVHKINPNDTSYLAIANEKGKYLNVKIIPRDSVGHDYGLKAIIKSGKNRIALLDKSGGLIRYYNEKLQQVGEYQSTLYKYIDYQFDLDGDGDKEEVYFSYHNDYLVAARNNFKSPALLKYKVNFKDFPCFSVKLKNGKPVTLCLSQGAKLVEFSYKKNLIFIYRYLIYIAIFLLIFVIVSLIGFYYQRLLKMRYRAEEKMRALQQQAIEQQLSPHFTLNILNSIGALYENRKTETARVYMGKYSKLLQENLLASGEITTSFRQEMDFVKNYLDLEQFRYNNKFSYTISCEAVNIPVPLPRLLIYTFVENALKHGLFHVMGIQPAHLDIQCSDEEKSWMVVISDNGIGRKVAAKIQSFSTGKGLEIMQETLKLYQSLKHRKITFAVEDMHSEKEYTGTKVTILIQKKMDKKM